MLSNNGTTPKPGIFGWLLRIIGLSKNPEQSKRAPTITETLQRVGQMDNRLQHMEQVTMSFTTAELTEDQMREIGLIE